MLSVDVSVVVAVTVRTPVARRISRVTLAFHASALKKRHFSIYHSYLAVYFYPQSLIMDDMENTLTNKDVSD